MKKHTLISNILFILSVFLTQQLYAVPANPRPFTITQKDGTTMEVRLVGDENYSYYCTMDGMPLVKLNDAYYYADMDNNGKLCSAGILAHESHLRKANEIALINLNKEKVMAQIHNVWSNKLEVRNEQRQKATEARKVRQKAFGHPTSYKGQKKGIVILINYADLPMKETSTRDAWDEQFNKKGYNKNNHIGSVRDYFLDQSYQQLEINFDVVGPYTVSKGWRYYGKQNSSDSDSHPCQLVSEACKLANADVNFKDYDWNNDGEVDQVFVVYAGYSAAAGYDDDAIWPHEWNLSYGTYYGDGQGALRLDGVKIDTYALSSELNGTKGSTMDMIGVAVHEFSHCLGLPDFYDVDDAGTQCMDYWDVLDKGCYSGPNWIGEVPTGYTAYERNFAGWLEFEELTLPQKVTKMEDLGETPKAYIYYNQGNKKEYFILENRQAKNWFKYPVGAHGLFVYHVDYDQSLWENDRPNSDPNHPRMTFIPADKSFDRSYTDRMVSDFFPGTKNVRTLNNTSHTSCYGKMFNKNSDGTYNINMNLTSITENLGKISFTFNGGEAALITELGTLIKDVKALLEIPHADITEGTSTLLSEAITEAEEAQMSTSTSAEYSSAIKNLKKKAVEFLFQANPTDTLQPFDITFLLDNPDISSNEGWKEEIANNGFTYANNCGAYENLKFTLSQSIAYKLPKGKYTLTCQGFQRTGTLEESDKNAVNCLMFARSKSVKIKNILDEAAESKKSINDKKTEEETYVPGDQKGANSYFKADMYTNSLDFENTMASGTSVKLGLKCSMAKVNYWTCFANFKLYFKGAPEDENAIEGISSTPQAHNAERYDLSGRKQPKTNQRKGIFIQNGKKKL